MKKFLLSFLASVIAWTLFGFSASAETVTLDFSTAGFNNWDSSYSNRTQEFDIATVVFASANKQASTITDCPVTKGGDVIVTFKEGITASHIKFTLKQWTNKAQTVTLHTSTDGGKNFTSTGITSSTFAIEGDLTSDVTDVKITFSSNSNQVGIASADVTYTTAKDDSKQNVTMSFPEESYNADINEPFTIPELTIEPESLKSDVTYESSEPAVATVDPSSGNVELLSTGETTITAKFDGNESYNLASASYTIIVTDKSIPTTVLNPTFFDYTASSYTAKTVTDDYGITYSVVYSCSDTKMTFNPNNNNGGKASGLVVTANESDYIVKSITLDVNSVNDNSLDVYTLEEGFFSELAVNGGSTTTPTIPSEATKVKSSIGAGKTTVDINAKAFAVYPAKTSGKAVMINGITVTYMKADINAVDTPKFNPNGGEVEIGSTVEITCDTPEAQIFYTVDGETPTKESLMYTEDGITIDQNMTIKAIAIKEGMTDSNVATASFTVVEAGTQVATFNFTDVTTLGLGITSTDIPSNGYDLSDKTLTSGDVTLSFSKGTATGDSSFPRLWISSGVVDFRIYNGNYFIVGVDENEFHITKMVFTKDAGSYVVTPSAGSFSAETGIWTPATENARSASDSNYSDVLFNVTGTTRIGTLSVSYAPGNGVITGVDEVAADSENAAVEYYNLQGVRVENPTTGLYIKRQGSTVTKVLVK